MEEAQPSTVGGDGAPTAMVAVPGLPGALTQGYPFLGGSGTVSMEASLRLRAKDYAAHDRWLVNLQDVITSNRLDDLWENQQVPTLEAVQRQFPKETSDKQQELFSIAMKQWQTQGHSEVRSTGARNTQVIRAQLHRNGQACEAVRRRMHCVCSQVQYCHVS